MLLVPFSLMMGCEWFCLVISSYNCLSVSDGLDSEYLIDVLFVDYMGRLNASCLARSWILCSRLVCGVKSLIQAGGAGESDLIHIK
jgi:hypothetical protein